jgi:hypothetical protein
VPKTNRIFIERLGDTHRDNRKEIFPAYVFIIMFLYVVHGLNA